MNENNARALQFPKLLGGRSLGEIVNGLLSMIGKGADAKTNEGKNAAPDRIIKVTSPALKHYHDVFMSHWFDKKTMYIPATDLAARLPELSEYLNNMGRSEYEQEVPIFVEDGQYSMMGKLAIHHLNGPSYRVTHITKTS